MHNNKQLKNCKQVLIVMMLLVSFFMLSSAVAGFDGTSSTYSLGSSHTGIEGDTGESDTYSMTFTTDFNQPVDDDAESLTYSATIGWLSVTQTGTSTVNSVECSNDSINYYDCATMTYGMSISHIRANCTTDQGSITSVKFSLNNEPDGISYINRVAATYKQGDYYILNSSYYLIESGDWNLTVECIVSQTTTNITNWTIPWGWLNVSILQPTVNTSVTLFKSFTFQSRVICVGGECGMVNATLDPKQITTAAISKITVEEIRGLNEERETQNILPLMLVSMLVGLFLFTAYILRRTEHSTFINITYILLIAGFVVTLLHVIPTDEGVTGFAVMETHEGSYGLNQTFSSDTNITFSTEGTDNLTQLKISGEIIGEGAARIYLVAEDEKLLLYEKITNITDYSITYPPEKEFGTGSINISLDYYEDSQWDTNNDGIAGENSVVDLSTSKALFGFNVDDYNLCTRWEIYSIETEERTYICNGDDQCCGMLELGKTEDDWNSTLNIFIGRYGATRNNVISSQVVAVNNQSLEYSGWENLTARFVKEIILTNECQKTCDINIEKQDYMLQIELDGTTLDIESLDYETTGIKKPKPKENITKEHIALGLYKIKKINKEFGKKTKDEIAYETIITDIIKTDNRVSITFYHNNTGSLPIWVEGDVNYNLSSDRSSYLELVTLNVSLVKGITPRFKLHVGRASEIFEFGKIIPAVQINNGNFSLIDRNDTKIDVDITKYNESVKIKGLLDEINISIKIEETNISYLKTNIVAVEQSIGVEEAEIVLEKKGDIKSIMYCGESYFNYSTLECTNWVPTDTPFTENSTSLIFTVTGFTAYAGGNITANETGYMIIWDETDPGMPNASQSIAVGEQVKFFADYKSSQNGSKITDANCTVSINGSSYMNMTYNTTYTYYVYNRSFAGQGVYSYTVMCNHTTFNNLNSTDVLSIPSSVKSGAVSTITGAVPFYTTSLNPQTCNASREGDSCTITWTVNATGILDSIHEFFVWFNMTSNQAYVTDNTTESVYLTISSNDSTAPIIQAINTIPQPVNYSENISLYVTATDNVQIDECLINLTYPNTTSVIFTNACDQAIIVTTTSMGRHNLTITVNDTEGYSTSETSYFDVVDTKAPTIEFVNITTAIGNYSQNFIEANVTASDNFNLTNITIYLYNSTLGLLQSNTSTTSPYFVNYTGLTNGTYYINATAEDINGNSNSTETRIIILDTVIPYINFTSITTAAGNYSQSHIDVNITAIDSLAGLDTITLYIYNSSFEVVQTNTSYLTTPLTVNVTGLTNGTYYINATANDTAGNLNNTETRTIILDMEGPMIRFVDPTPSAGNYSQTFIEANVTAADALTALDTITIYLYNSSGLVQTNTSETSPFFVNFTGLPEDTYYLNATANDTLGNMNMTETIIILDTTPPYVNFTDITTETGSYNQSYIDVNITASNFFNSIIFLLFNSSLEVIQTNISINSPLTVNVTGLPDGIYYMNGTANDSAGNYNTTPQRTIILDTTSPAIEFVDPTPLEGNYSQNFIQVNLSVIDALSNISNITIYLYNSTGQVQNISNTTSFFVNFTGLSDGTYYINATANDTLGHINSTETRTIVLDTIIPYINFTNITTTTGNYSQSHIDVNITATDALAGLDTITLYIYNSSFEVVQTNTSYLSSPLTVNVTDLNDGTYYINATVNDTAGNMNYTETRTIVLDTTGPYINFINITTTTGNYSQSHIDVNITAIDSLAGLDTITFYLYNSSFEVVQTNTSYLSSPLTVNITSLADGTYYINATANDTAGNLNNTETRTIVLDTIIPYINFTNITTTTGNYSQSHIDVNITATDALAGLDTITLYIYNSSFEVVQTNTSYLSSPLTVNVTDLNDGTYYINATVNDTAGNMNYTETRTIVLDTTAPPIQFVEPTTTSGLKSQDYILVNVTSSDFDSIVVYLYNSSLDLIYMNISTTSSFYINYANLDLGVYYLNATVNDTVGYTNSTETRTITLSNINMTSYRNRVFYEDGTPINISVEVGQAGETLSTNLSAIDSEYTLGDEVITDDGNGNYFITYNITEANTKPNGVYIISIEINNTPINITIGLYLYNGETGLSDRWDSGLVLKASACAAGNPASEYFLENGTCPTINYLGQEEGLDAIFANREVAGAATEFICKNGVDDDKTYGGESGGADGADCADKDCASIVYGEPPPGSSKTRPFWTCVNTTLGWRDDPPLNTGDVTCDATTNLCTGSILGTNYGRTYFFYTYNVGPGGNFSIRFQQSSGLNGLDVQFKLTDSLSPTLNNYSITSEFKIINESSSTGFSEDDSYSSGIAFYVQDNDYEQSDLDFTYKLPIRTDAGDGNHTITLARGVAGGSSDYDELGINFTIESTDPVYEHDVSCYDTCTGSGPSNCDNDLDYLYNCEDDDCDLYQGGAQTYQICAYQNESQYSLTNNSCADNFDNDADGTTDCVWSGAGGGTPDTDCNGTYIVNSSQWLSNNIGADNGTCQLSVELTCNDLFDNDRDGQYDCILEQVNGYSNTDYSSDPTDPKITYTGGTGAANYPDAEYNCDIYCRANNASTETGTSCLDGKDNDWDFYNTGTITKNTTGGGIDCRMVEYDVDCNQTAIGGSGELCELIFEANCSDSYDNDRDGEYDCVVASTGSSETNPEYQYGIGGSNIADGEYDCQTTCNVSANLENNASKCSDNKDNDLDYWTITSWSGTQYTTTNNQYAGGMDCRFNYDGTHYPDSDCDGVDMGAGNCELGTELNCSDEYDNDQDNAYNFGGNRTYTGGYDCDDYDCAGSVSCPSTETGTQCLDGIDNDLDRYVYNTTAYLRDTNRIVNTSNGVDCVFYYNNSGTIIRPTSLDYASDYNDATLGRYSYDPDCNNTIISGSNRCELIVELNCSDGYDNDQDYYVRPGASGTGTVYIAGWDSTNYNAYFSSSYSASADCDDYSCSGSISCPSNESNSQCQYGDCDSNENWCLDGTDNDLDDYDSMGINQNSTTGIGVDCAWTTQNYDSDCNNTLINDSGYVGMCTIGWEINCSDSVDNDQDSGYEVNAGYSTGVDCDDYNCYAQLGAGQINCTGATLNVETNCSDGIDNDLDKYTWNGAAYVEDTNTGIDCADPDCNGIAGPDGVACGDEDNKENCKDYDTDYYAADNDYDGPANCYDSGCYNMNFDGRYCPSTEYITLDACADSLDNQMYYQDENVAKTGAYSLSYYGANKNTTLYPSELVDCNDPDCVGKIALISGDHGICAGSNSFISESDCSDNLDNDMDAFTDCEDSDCSGDSSCPSNPSNTVTACSGAGCTIAGFLAYGDGDAKNATITDLGTGGTVDLIYTRWIKRGENMTWSYSDTGIASSIYLYAGTATNSLPTYFDSATQPNTKFGPDQASFSEYTTSNLAALEAASYSGSFDIGVELTLPSDDEIVINSGSSCYSYDIYTLKDGGGKTESVTTCVIEDIAPEVPVFVKTPTSVSLQSSIRRIRSDNTVYRIRVTDTVNVYVNASDNTSYNADATFNTGLERIEFANSTSSYANGGTDGIHSLTIADGSNTVYVRAVDGVGNVGQNTSLIIDVITIPRQDTNITCSMGNCSVSYPTRKYYNESESLPITINFTSDVDGFSDNSTGCVVKAETSSSIVVLGSVSLNTTSDNKTATCNGTVSLSSLSENFYYITIQVLNNNSQIAISGEQPYNDDYSKEHLWLCNHTVTRDGWTCLSSDNEPPRIQFTNITTPSGYNSQTHIDATIIASDNFDIDTITFYIYNSSGLMWSNTSASSPYYANTTDLPAGTYYINASVNDTSGNMNYTETITIMLDADNVRIEFNDPTTSTGNYSRTYIEANASAINFHSIIFYLYNSTSIVQSNISITTPYFVNYTNLANALYYLNATANDTLGDTNATEVRTIILDTTEPYINFVDITTTGNNSQAYIDINISVTDPLAGVDTITFYLYNSSFEIIQTNTSTTSPLTVNISLANGTYYINATANDTLGQTNYSETRIIVLDTVDPYINFVDSTSSAGNYSMSYIEANISATDALAGLDTITFYLYNSSFEVIQTNISYLTSPLTVINISLGDGTYYINASINDTAGNLNNTETRKIVFDASSPTSTTPPDYEYQVNSSGAIDWMLYDNLATGYYYVMRNGTTQNISTTWLNATNLNVWVNTSTVGVWNYTIFFNDSLGNYNSDTVIITVSLTLPNNPPVMRDMLPADNTISNENVTFSCNATDDIQLANISLYSNFTGAWLVNLTNVTTGIVNSTNFTLTLAEGVYIWNCLATDNASQTDFGDSNKTLTVDTTVPYINFINVTTIGNNSQSHIQANISSTDEFAGLDTITFYIYNSTREVVLNTTSSAGLFLVNTTGLTDGTYYINATANDTLGQSNSTETRTIILDTTVPYINFVDVTTIGNNSQSHIQTNISSTDTLAGIDTIIYYLYNSTGLVLNSTSDSSPFLINTTGLDDGTYYINATANDTAGNLNNTETRTIILDTLTPNIDFVDVTTAAGNYGRTYIDANITSSDIFIGLDTITFYLYNSSGEVVQSNTSLTSPLSVNITGLDSDVYYINATANDTVNNLNYTETRTIILDTTAPTSTTPPDYAYQNGTSGAIEWVLYDNLATGYYYVMRNETTQNISTTWLNATNLNVWVNTSTVGVWNYTIFFNDSLGNYNSDTVIITVSLTLPNNPPVMRDMLPADNTISNENVTFSCNATDDIQLANISLYSNFSGVWIVNSTNITTGTVNSTNFTLTLAEGVYIWNCLATDNASQTDFGDSNKTLTVDTTEPYISFIDVTTATGNYSQNYIDVNISAIDNFALGDLMFYLYNSSKDLIYTNLATGHSPLTMTNYTGLSNGTYYINATANDTVGNMNYTETRTIILDTEAPTSTTPPDYAYLQNSSGSIEWVLYDNLATGYYYVMRNGTTQNISTTWLNATNLNVWVNTTEIGVWNYTTFFNDSLGNYNSDTVTITVSGLLPDNPPVMRNMLPADNTISNENVTFICNATDDQQLANISLYGNFSGVWIVNSTNITTGTVNSTNFTLTLAEGVYIWNCLATDNSSQTDFGDNNLTVKVDTTNPYINFIDVTTASGNYSRSYIDANISATDALAGLDTITFYIYNSTELVLNTTSSSSPFFINTTGLTDGIYYINATVNDTVGNLNNTETRTIMLDTTGPYINFTNITTAGNNSQSYIQANINSTDALVGLDTITFYLYNSSGSVLNTSSTSSPFFINTTGLTDGTYYINATANDTLGQSNSTETRTILLDTTTSTINSTYLGPTLVSYGDLVYFNATATDNIELNKCQAIILLPNSSSATVEDICSATLNYTVPQLTGTYNVNFTAIDNANNTNISEGSFFRVSNPINFTISANTTNSSVNVSIKMIDPLTSYIIYQNETNTSITSRLPVASYDFIFRTFNNSVQITMRGVNISEDNNKSISIDKTSTVSDYLKVYAVETDYNFTNSTLLINYSDVLYSNEERLNLFTCTNWTFVNRTCNSGWITITSNSTQNTTNNTFEYLTTSFSGFAISESAVAQSSSGGGGSVGGAGGAAPITTEEGLEISDDATCDDGIQNCQLMFDGLALCEEDVDCGGPCEACPTCYDGILNQNEEGIDCGGECDACPTCYDGLQNGAEEGVDCGGACQACPTCYDGIRNGNELGVDCGGECSSCIEALAPEIIKKLPYFILLIILLTGGYFGVKRVKKKMEKDEIEEQLVNILEKSFITPGREEVRNNREEYIKALELYNRLSKEKQHKYYETLSKFHSEVTYLENEV